MHKTQNMKHHTKKRTYGKTYDVGWPVGIDVGLIVQFREESKYLEMTHSYVIVGMLC